MPQRKRRRVVAVQYRRTCCCSRELFFVIGIACFLLAMFVFGKHLPDTGMAEKVMNLLPRTKVTERIMEHRKRRLTESCSRYYSLRAKPLTQTNLKHMHHDEQHKILYCAVEKAGTTFWRRFLRQLRLEELDSPYRILPKDAMLNSNNLLYMDTSDFETVLKTSVKFLFVRNPFDRLLSGYIDKLYSPNPYFWKTLGRHIISTQRKGDIDELCGHDVTFEEFITYVINAETYRAYRDGHFTPASDLCNPCSVKFDLVGKTETFTTDTYHILRVLNLSHYMNFLQNFEEDAAQDAMEDTLHTFFSIRKSAHECLSPRMALARLWRKLQLRGIISSQIQCPIPDREAGTFSVRMLRDAMRTARRKSEKKQLKLQKYHFLTEAYQSIPISKLTTIANLFQHDFQLFDYEPFPDELFVRSESKKSEDIFDINPFLQS